MITLSQPLSAPEFLQNPYPFYAEARRKGPVVFWQELGMPAVFDAEGVSRLLRARSLGREPLTPRPAPAHLAAFRALEHDSLLELEPPRHTRLRNLVLRAFTSRRVAALAPDIEQIAAELIATCPRETPFDLIRRFCQPLPVRIIARLLGVPETLAPDLLSWSSDMVAMYQTGVTPEIEARAGRAAAEFTEFLRGYIASRRSDPRDDLITHLIAAEEDGARLSSDEMIATCVLLLNAGHEATVHSLGNAVRVLIEHGTAPHPENAAQITEELLRFEAPLHVFTRFCYEPMQLLEGVRLARGDEVALVLGAANRDPALYDAPDVFDPRRPTPKHSSFGGGLHFCVGAPLARAEMSIALPMLFAAFETLELAAPPRFADSYHFHKHDSLCLRAT